MENSLTKIKGDVSSAPIAAVVGGTIGWALAKNLKYEKTISVASFIVVGVIIGTAIGYRINKN